MKDCSRPVTAFLTFENEEGLNRAINYNETVLKDDRFENIRNLCDVHLKIEEASEPTDIIWENRQFTAKDRFYRSLIVSAGILGLLFLSFIIIFVLSTYSVSAALKYPSVNCNDFESMFGTDLIVYAFDEFNYNTENPDDAVWTGQLACFCTAAQGNSDVGYVGVASYPFTYVLADG